MSAGSVARILRLCLVAGVIALSGCGSTSTPTPASDIFVHFLGPTVGSWPPQEMLVEIGEESWSVPAGDGYGSFITPSDTEQQVRVLWAAGCVQLLSFSAEPSGTYEVRFNAANEATYQDLHGEPIPMGPGFGDPGPSPCP